MLKVLEPKDLQPKPHYYQFVNEPSVMVAVSKEELSVHRCYKTNFYYCSSDRILELTFNKFKVYVKLLRDIPVERYLIEIQEVNLENYSYIVIKGHEFKQKCKLRYKNVEIQIEEI